MQNRLLLPPIILSLVLACSAAAKEPLEPAAVDEGSLWDISLLAGIGFTDGNTDTLAIQAGFTAEKLTSVDEIYLGTNFFYGEDNGATTQESVYSYAQYNRMLSERAYLGLVGDFLYDDVAAVDYRVNVVPTLGYYLIKTERTALALEVGAGYRWEDVGGMKGEYWTARFGQRLTHQLTDSLSLFESAVFVPELEDFDNYDLLIRAGIESRMTDRLSLRIYAENRYDSTPAAGLEKNDFGVYSGLSLALGASDPLPAADGPKGGGVLVGGSDWDVDLGVGFSLTDGNSDTLSLNADLAATRITDDNEIYLGAGGAYGETSDVRNTERVYAFGQYNKMLGDPFYAGARVDFLYDDIMALDYRVTPSLLAGAYLVNNDTTKLAVEVGPSFTWEDQMGVKNEYFGVQVGERFSHQLNDRVELWQTLGLVLDVENTDNVVVNAAAGFDVKIGERLSLRTAVENISDSEVPAGIEKNDFRLTSGLVLSF